MDADENDIEIIMEGRKVDTSGDTKDETAPSTSAQEEADTASDNRNEVASSASSPKPKRARLCALKKAATPRKAAVPKKKAVPKEKTAQKKLTGIIHISFLLKATTS